MQNKFLAELGLISLYRSPSDVKILILQRFVRFFAFGGSTIVLVLYLKTLSVPDSRIGLFMSLTLVGDLVSFALALFADGLGRKLVLALGALLMAMSGVMLAVSGNYWLLLASAVFGVVSPNGREIGPFSAIEESTIAQLTPGPLRSDIFAWYTVIGSAGSSCGKLATGWIVQHLQTIKGWNQIQSYRAVFLAYAGLGIMHMILTCILSSKVEAETHKFVNADSGSAREAEPLMTNREPEDAVVAVERKSLLPKISKESRAIVIKLCLLFAVDSLASGLVPASWVAYFFNFKFGLLEGQLGSLFFATGLLSAASSIVAASLSKRIGLVQTMVFTHLPSAIALALIPLPSSLTWAIVFLVVRSSLASMDIAPKAAFLSAVVLPGERTAIMGFIAAVRTFSQSCGPVVTGVLAQAGKFWVTFIVAGMLKASYDIGLLAMFKSHKTHEDGQDGIKEEEEEEEERGTTTNIENGRPIS